MGYLVDSNVLIDYVSERFTPAQLSKLDGIFDEALIVSVISRIETLGFSFVVPEEEQKLLLFFTTARILELSEEVILQTILLRKTIRLKTPDAIIASTARVNNFTLLSRNLSDFGKVPGLKTENPHSW